ncbi:MAG: hypothetical protein ABI601_02760 [bacterium]
MTLTPALRIAAGCAALALLADVGLLVRATRSPDEQTILPLRIAAVTPIVPRKAEAEALIDSARASEPFEPLGATQTLASASTVIPQATPMPAVQPRLIGTVVAGAESFVMMAMTDGTMKVVRVGERAGELRLRSVSAGGAVFDDSHGDRVTLRSPTPGSEPQP